MSTRGVTARVERRGGSMTMFNKLEVVEGTATVAVTEKVVGWLKSRQERAQVCFQKLRIKSSLQAST